MTLIDRILPVEEWAKLKGTDLESLISVLDPTRTEILVVEDGDRIVGHLAWVSVDHADGAWIHPDYRHNVRVARRLWRGMKQRLRSKGADRVVISASEPKLTRMFRRFVAMPVQEFVVCLKTF